MDWHGTCAALALRLPISCRSCSATASDEELCAWPNVRVESEFTWKAMLVLDALCRGQRFAMICIWCKIHKCPPNPQSAKLSNALPVFPRVCLSASVSDKRQEHIVQQKCKLKEVRVIAILVVITIITNHTIVHHLYLHLNFVAQKPGPPKTALSGFQFLAVAVQQWQLSKHFEPPRNTDRW